MRFLNVCVCERERERKRKREKERRAMKSIPPLPARAATTREVLRDSASACADAAAEALWCRVTVTLARASSCRVI